MHKYMWSCDFGSNGKQQSKCVFLCKLGMTQYEENEQLTPQTNRKACVPNVSLVLHLQPF